MSAVVGVWVLTAMLGLLWGWVFVMLWYPTMRPALRVQLDVMAAVGLFLAVGGALAVLVWGVMR